MDVGASRAEQEWFLMQPSYQRVLHAMLRRCEAQAPAKRVLGAVVILRL